MDIRHGRATFLVAGLLALGVAGVTGIALAQSSKGPSTTAAREVDDVGPEATSSVTVPPAQAATEADEGADEGTALQGLAKITPDQARTAAVAAVPGNATKVELENKDGSVVYAVEVTGTDGRTTDLEIDAGNGAVLSKETEEADEAPGSPDRGDEANEANESKEQPEAKEADEAPEAPEKSESPEKAGD